jgi:flagellar basal-body rod modification protein FlgD
MVSTVQSLPNDVGTQLPGKDKLQLKAQDFIKMMITQLQQQDPMEPAKNDQLLAQMSQISQLQSSTQLSDSLKGMVQQNQIGSAATLIGKTVQGLDGNNDPISGLVTSVRVSDDGASLQLDNGQELMMTRVTSIGPGATTTPAPAAAAAAT